MNLEELMASTPLMQQHALIKGFQAGATSRDAEVAKWKAAEHSLSDAYLRLRGLLDAFDTPRGVTAEQVWEHTEGKLIYLISERDQLRAQINVLREALGKCRFDSLNMNIDNFKFCQNAFATTPEQSLAEYRNKVIEAFVNEFSRHVGGDGEFWLHELQDFAMKEQP